MSDQPSLELMTLDPAQTTASEPTSMLALIVRATTDPAVDIAKMEALLRMQRQLEADQARSEFNAAYMRLTGRMPRVKKNGRVDLGAGKGSYAFAKWEDIDRIIRPMLAAEGFGLTFNSTMREGGGLVVCGQLLHSNGHSISAEMPLPLDTGAGRNNLQAAGSTLSYGKRYVAEMLLNIVREGEDDDGMKGGNEPITPEQLQNLTAMLPRASVSVDAFCKRWGIETLADLDQSHFPEAMNGLSARANRRSDQ